MSDLDFIEACYEEAPEEAVWGARVAECLARLVPEAVSVLGASYRVDSQGLRYLSMMGDARFAGDPAQAEDARRCATSLNESPRGRLVLNASYGRPRPTMVVVSDLPREIVALCAAWAKGELCEARRIHQALFDVTGHLFIESNPVPVKTALARSGAISAEVRAPLAPLRPENLKALEASLAAFESARNI